MQLKENDQQTLSERLKVEMEKVSELTTKVIVSIATYLIFYSNTKTHIFVLVTEFGKENS